MSKTRIRISDETEIEELELIVDECEEFSPICRRCDGTGSDPLSTRRPDEGGGIVCSACGGSGIHLEPSDD